jgi:hypothetical protein
MTYVYMIACSMFASYRRHLQCVHGECLLAGGTAYKVDGQHVLQICWGTVMPNTFGPDRGSIQLYSFRSLRFDHCKHIQMHGGIASFASYM